MPPRIHSKLSHATRIQLAVAEETHPFPSVDGRTPATAYRDLSLLGTAAEESSVQGRDKRFNPNRPCFVRAVSLFRTENPGSTSHPTPICCLSVCRQVDAMPICIADSRGFESMTELTDVPCPSLAGLGIGMAQRSMTRAR